MAPRRQYVQVPLGEFLLRVGKKVKARRLECGWDQPSLAKACGMKQNAISMLETGKRVPTLQVLHRLAWVLECDVTALLPGSRRRLRFKDRRRKPQEDVASDAEADSYPEEHG
jgi:transcriptional regulator with XRE-family HTH domain